jgi:hypothetical protein
MTKFSLFLGGALLALSSLSPAAKFYKWVDDKGVTHYDAQAPQGANTTEINTRATASSSQSEAIEALETKGNAARSGRSRTLRTTPQESGNPDQQAHRTAQKPGNR